MFIKDELPFKFVEGEGFLEYMNIVCLRFEVPSQRTIARDVWQMYMNENVILKSILSANRQRVCIMTDIWTSIQNTNYIGVTAHFIDQNWGLHKRILSFKTISSHKGEAIGKLIESCLLDWGIESVFTITVDNASANDIAVSYVKKKLRNWKGDLMVLNGDYVHLRCSAHIINLIVQDGLKEVNESITSVRNAVKYIRSSPSRLHKSINYVEREKITCKGLTVLDVPTKWNSTYLMLDSALKFTQAFERMNDDDELYQSWFMEYDNRKKRSGPPKADDWDNARRLVKFFKIFYDVTLKFSASTSVTSNIYLNEMWKIRVQLNTLIDSYDPLLGTMASNIKRKFDKYWGSLDKINKLLIIAVVLDLRYKLDVVVWCFSSLYDSKKVEELKNMLKQLLFIIFQSYSALDSNIGGTNSSQSNCFVQLSEVHNEIGSEDNLDHLTQFKKMKQNVNDMEGKTEIDKYLLDPDNPSNENFDILSWWKLNRTKYPILSRITKDIFAISASTVASESAFSTGGRILDPFRSSLTPKTVEALICTQNWMRSTLLSDHMVVPTMEETESYEVVEAEFQKTQLSQRTSDDVIDV